MVAPCHSVFHLGSLHRQPGISLGCSFHHHGVAPCISFVHLREGYLKGGPLVFFHTEVASLAHGSYTIQSRQSTLWQHEVGGSHSVIVRRDSLLCHHFPVGIIQFHLHLLVLLKGLGISPTLIDGEDSSGMHRLSGTIDGSVGIQIDDGLVVFLLIVACTREIDVSCRTVLVGRGRKQHASVHVLEVCLALGIGGESGMHNTLMLLGFEVVVVVSVEFYLCTGNGLSARGTNHYIAVPFVGQLLYHHSQIAHIEESSGWRHTRIIGRHLHEISAYGQRWQQDGVFHLLVVGMTVKQSAVFFLVQR